MTEIGSELRHPVAVEVARVDARFAAGRSGRRQQGDELAHALDDATEARNAVVPEPRSESLAALQTLRVGPGVGRRQDSRQVTIGSGRVAEKLLDGHRQRS